MHSIPPHDAVAEAIAASTDAVLDLQTALTGVGVTLPSLGVDLVSCTRSSAPRPLVELGRCTVDVARALAEILRKAAR